MVRAAEIAALSVRPPEQRAADHRAGSTPAPAQVACQLDDVDNHELICKLLEEPDLSVHPQYVS